MALIFLSFPSFLSSPKLLHTTFAICSTRVGSIDLSTYDEQKRKQAKEQQKVNRLLLHKLPYYGYDILSSHGYFNNLLTTSLLTKKYLEKLRSIHDLDLVNVSTYPDSHTDQLNRACIRCQYYTPHSFNELKNTLGKGQADYSFSIFQNNIRSIRRKFENLQTHLLAELDFPFPVIGLTPDLSNRTVLQSNSIEHQSFDCRTQSNIIELTAK